MTAIDAHNHHTVASLAPPRPPANTGLPVHPETHAQPAARHGPEVVVELSAQAVDAAAGHDPEQTTPASQTQPDHDQQPHDREGQAQHDPSRGQALSEEEQKQVQQLKERDRQVRQHEAAHKAAAGQFARGGPTFDFQTGPDGKQYAIGGEVQIDTSPVEGDPQATIRKMQAIQRAAMAPHDPSSQDRAVAAQAARVAQQAQMQLSQKSTQDSQPAPAQPSVGAADPAAGQGSDLSTHDATTGAGARPPTGAKTIRHRFSGLDGVVGRLLDLAA